MKVLIVVHSPTWFTELLQLGTALRESRKHDVVFYIVDFKDPAMHELASTLRNRNLACVLECDRAPTRPRHVRMIATIKSLVHVPVLAYLYRFFDELEILAGAVANVRALARSERPVVAVIGGDNPAYTTPAVIRGLRREGVPTAIVSSTMSNGREEAEVNSSDPRYYVSSLGLRALAALFPKWVTRHHGRRLFRCRPARVLALESLRLAPPKPWAFNSGAAEAIAAESEAMIDYYAEAGLPRAKMVLTGSPSDDAMTRALKSAPRMREEVYTELGLPPGRPMLLLALVPDLLYLPGGRPQSEFQSYTQIVEAFVGPLRTQSEFNVVISLHPSVDPSTMRHLNGEHVRIATRRAAELLPLCDVFVASSSSTIRWAIACAKPVVNYDIYRYRYTDFLGAAGVLLAEDSAAYSATIARLATDPDFLATMRAKQQVDAARWGRLDGRGAERIAALLEGLATGSRSASGASA